MVTEIKQYLNRPASIAPLVIFRIAFGVLMLLSLARFIARGWVESMYILPKIYFPYYGFEWVKPLPAAGMYIVFGLMLLCCLGILLGAFYRLSSMLFFALFTYVELIDKTNYLNHYYFISLVSFLLIFLPAGKHFSLDNKIFKREEQCRIPQFYILILQLQVFSVYFFAGVAKLNYDWLIEAQPLRIWLPAFSHYPLIGTCMESAWVAYLFSWFSCIYDLAIGFLLFNRRSVGIAYFFVILFHLATAAFFNIGMFPYIMITITIIFFSEHFHIRVLEFLKKIFRFRTGRQSLEPGKMPAFVTLVFVIFMMVQLAMPFRYLLYNGKLFWTEQGYRFSWRVMLMEKAGTAFFYVREKNSGRETEVDNKHYLTYLQEKMMATQPDMMVDYAKFLKKEFEAKGMRDVSVRAECFVTLNGSGTRQFIDPQVDLSAESNSFLRSKPWVISYQ